MRNKLDADIRRTIIFFSSLSVFLIVSAWFLYLNNYWIYADYYFDLVPALILLIAGFYELIYKKSLFAFIEILKFHTIILIIIFSVAAIWLGLGAFGFGVLPSSVVLFWSIIFLITKLVMTFKREK